MGKLYKNALLTSYCITSSNYQWDSTLWFPHHWQIHWSLLLIIKSWHPHVSGRANTHFPLSFLCFRVWPLSLSLHRRQGSGCPPPASPSNKSERKCVPSCVRYKRSIKRAGWLWSAQNPPHTLSSSSLHKGKMQFPILTHNGLTDDDRDIRKHQKKNGNLFVFSCVNILLSLMDFYGLCSLLIIFSLLYPLYPRLTWLRNRMELFLALFSSQDLVKLVSCVFVFMSCVYVSSNVTQLMNCTVYWEKNSVCILWLFETWGSSEIWYS